MQETWVWSLGQEDPLEEEMASAPVWTEESGELQSMGLQKSQTRHTYFNYDSKPTSLFMA